MNTYDDKLDTSEFDDVEGSDVGVVKRQWDYPGIGYDLTKGRLYFNSERVPELKVTVYQLAQWKNVVEGKGKQKRVVASYPIFTRSDNMVAGDKVENKLQIVLEVGGEFYVFGTSSVNGVGAWLKDERNARYYAQTLPLGVWTQLQNHIARVKRETGKNIPQYGWEFMIAPSETEIRTGGEYDIEITPLIRTSSFKFVGKERFEANMAKYLAEDLDNWQETRSNPNGAPVVSDENGTYEMPLQEPEGYSEDVSIDDEIPF